MGHALTLHPLTDLYPSEFISPFLLVQSGDTAHQIYVSTDPETHDVGIATHHYKANDLPLVSSIEEAEDYYLDRAVIFSGHHRDRLDVPDVTVFALNAQSTVQGKTNRRGNAWVALMHPVMFERISRYPGPNVMWQSPKLAGEPCWVNRLDEGEFTIGRWSLIAREPYRNLHVWTSEHLPKNTMTTIWRSPNSRHLFDGLVVLKNDDGFRLTPPEPGRGGYVKTAVLDQYEA